MATLTHSPYSPFKVWATTAHPEYEITLDTSHMLFAHGVVIYVQEMSITGTYASTVIWSKSPTLATLKKHTRKLVKTLGRAEWN